MECQSLYVVTFYLWKSNCCHSKDFSNVYSFSGCSLGLTDDVLSVSAVTLTFNNKEVVDISTIFLQFPFGWVYKMGLGFFDSTMRRTPASWIFRLIYTTAYQTFFFWLPRFFNWGIINQVIIGCGSVYFTHIFGVTPPSPLPYLIKGLHSS